MYTTVSARLDAHLKEEAEEVLSALGISHSAAISALYSQIVMQQGLPFDLKLPRPSLRLGPSYWEIRDSVRAVSEAYAIDSVWLFGAYASGAAETTSAVDLRVDESEGCILDHEALARELEQKLGVPVNVSITKNLSRRFLSSIKGDEELLFAR